MAPDCADRPVSAGRSGRFGGSAGRRIIWICGVAFLLMILSRLVGSISEAPALCGYQDLSGREIWGRWQEPSSVPADIRGATACMSYQRSND